MHTKNGRWVAVRKAVFVPKLNNTHRIAARIDIAHAVQIASRRGFSKSECAVEEKLAVIPEFCRAGIYFGDKVDYTKNSRFFQRGGFGWCVDYATVYKWKSGWQRKMRR